MRYWQSISILLLALAVALGSCRHAGDAGGKRLLMVSVPAQQTLLEALCGDEFEVRTLFDAGTDPETAEPPMAQVAAAGRAEAYFKVGGLPVEEAFLERMAKNGQKVRVVDTSHGIKRLADNAHGHGGDPHIWTSPANLETMAATMLRELVRLNPAGEQLYAERYAKLRERLEALRRQCASRLSRHKGEAIVVWHPSLGYFARDFGLRQIALEPEGKEASPRQVREALDEARRAGAAVVVTEAGHAPQRSAAIASELGAEVLEINLLSADIFGQINALADAVAR